MIMPEMNGSDLVKNMTRLWPGIKRLFMSGYTGNMLSHNGELGQGVHFIQKPFSIQDLDDLVASVSEGNPRLQDFECSIFDGIHMDAPADQPEQEQCTEAMPC